ncbi:MAG: hypothetical protein ABSG94_10270 [Brevinematales bacterium]
MKLKIVLSIAVLVLCGIILTAVLYAFMKTSGPVGPEVSEDSAVSSNGAITKPRIHAGKSPSSSSASAASSSSQAIEQYTISAVCEGSGSISPSGIIKVNEGDDMQFTITEVRGKTFTLDVFVNGEDRGMITSYTFTNVHSNQTIKALFQ